MTKPLTDAINALTTYANTVTGASDTDLSSAVATLANGYGQGGVMQLLDTITTTEDSRSVNIDLTPYTTDYDVIFVKADCTLSTSSWLYIQFNATEPTTGGYAYIGQYSVFTDVVCELLRNIINGATNYHVIIPTTKGNTGDVEVRSKQTVNNLFINTYEASTNILAGGEFRIYGMKYSDM